MVELVLSETQLGAVRRQVHAGNCGAIAQSGRAVLRRCGARDSRGDRPREAIGLVSPRRLQHKTQHKPRYNPTNVA